MLPSEKQRKREARPTSWASKYYQVDLVLLALVRGAAFYSQFSHHLPSPPLPHTPLASSKAQQILSTAKLPPALGKERGRERMKRPHSSLPAVNTHHPPWASGHLRGWVGAEPWACACATGTPESPSQLSVRTQWLCSWQRAWWARCFPM